MMRVLGKFGLWLLEPLMLKKLNSFAEYYNAGNFQRVLNVYSRPLIAEGRRSVIYENLLRVLCLLKIGDIKWKGEYKALVESGELDLLGQDDKNYVQFYISGLLDIPYSKRVEHYKYIIQNVSKRTQTFFPLTEIQGKT